MGKNILLSSLPMALVVQHHQSAGKDSSQTQELGLVKKKKNLSLLLRFISIYNFDVFFSSNNKYC